MKHSGIIGKLALTLVLMSFLAVSCRKKDDRPDYEYFISKELKKTFTRDEIRSLLQLAAGTYTQINDVLPYISSGVNVYKVTYRSVVYDDEIEASGLICVPDIEGNYPVICFHNGTNTVNANAPSNAPLSFLYQMIEVVSSLGYIVVFPDYPGFGESADIKHPYLLAEPTVRCVTDMLFTVRETSGYEFPGIKALNEFYLMGYSQGGWAALLLHKALELEFYNDFNLKGTVCGAGPYNLNLLMENILNQSTYVMPVYIGFLIDSYEAYNSFPIDVCEILNEPYCLRLSSLFGGNLNFQQINEQLTTSVPGLFTSGFLEGYASDSRFTAVREALANNSIDAWKSEIPLYMIHGSADDHVFPVATENMYSSMLAVGTSEDICKKEILPGVGHSNGVVPAMLKGLLFIMSLREGK
ncbi:MAG: alpha/beta hydrolase [Bacteroidales bacterium]|nr:alpha/beta hydrolase [Bacteroidales bacterium]